MAKEKFNREKPHVNVGTIAHARYGIIRAIVRKRKLKIKVVTVIAKCAFAINYLMILGLVFKRASRNNAFKPMSVIVIRHTHTVTDYSYKYRLTARATAKVRFTLANIGRRSTYAFLCELGIIIEAVKP